MRLFNNWFKPSTAPTPNDNPAPAQDPTSDIAEELFVETQAPETAETEFKGPKETTRLEELRSELQAFSETDRRVQGYHDCLGCTEKSAMQEGVERIIEEHCNLVSWTLTELDAQIVDYQRAIVQLEEIQLTDKAYRLEANKMQYETFRATCIAQLEEIRSGKGWVAMQLNTYRAGFKSALEAHIMNGFKK